MVEADKLHHPMAAGVPKVTDRDMEADFGLPEEHAYASMPARQHAAHALHALLFILFSSCPVVRLSGCPVVRLSGCPVVCLLGPVVCLLAADGTPL